VTSQSGPRAGCRRRRNGGPESTYSSLPLICNIVKKETTDVNVATKCHFTNNIMGVNNLQWQSIICNDIPTQTYWEKL
jgi:hypothetical protein